MILIIFHMNKAVARIREMTNGFSDLKVSKADEAWVMREGFKTLAQTIGLMAPHLAEEIWHMIGEEGLVANSSWIKADESLLGAENITIGVQVNGKVRGTITLPKGSDKDTTEQLAMNDNDVQKALQGLTIRKVIVVPDRIVNVVAG